MSAYLSEPFRIESLIFCSPSCVIGCSMFAVCLGAEGLRCHQRPLYFVSLCLSCVCPPFVLCLSRLCLAFALLSSCIGLALCLFLFCVQFEILEQRRIYMYICVRISVHPSTNVCVLHLNPAPVALSNWGCTSRVYYPAELGVHRQSLLPC